MMKTRYFMALLIVLYFMPGLLHASSISYLYDDAGRLIKTDYGEGKTIMYTYDANGNLLQVKISEGKQSQLAMDEGWNLLALPVEPGDDSVQSLFADVLSQVASIWKWDISGVSPVWSVYLPDDPEGDYATSKGFNQLSSISSGEGFWVNAGQAQDLNLTGSPITQTQLSFSDGWNLLGLLQDTATSVQDLLAANDALIKSIWKWDISGDSSVWSVYLPDDPEGNYAKSKGFNHLTSISPGEGFWVNVE
jgi:YD repeat-containing protein